MRLKAWLADRAPIAEVEAAIQHKTVPQHRHSIWYYLGGMTLFLFAVQVVTGILLLLYYRPSAGEAYGSVQFIMTRVPFGWLVRSIHSWSANLMVATTFIHLFSVLFLKAYRKPRELTWITGVLMLFLILAFGFTGYLLPWNELAFFATRVGTDIAGGARAELSGVDRLVFEGGRYALLAAGAAFAVPMFLGGGAGPLLPDWAWVLVKTVALLAVLVWLRRRLPAFRPDKFMEVGWMVLLPAVLLQDLVVAVIAVWRS